jgi:hypothetical protein
MKLKESPEVEKFVEWKDDWDFFERKIIDGNAPRHITEAQCFPFILFSSLNFTKHLFLFFSLVEILCKASLSLCFSLPLAAMPLRSMNDLLPHLEYSSQPM